MLYSHDWVSRTETNFTRDQIKTLLTGRRPAGLDEKGNVTLDVVKYLIYEPGPLPDALYNQAVQSGSRGVGQGGYCGLDPL